MIEFTEQTIIEKVLLSTTYIHKVSSINQSIKSPDRVCGTCTTGRVGGCGRRMEGTFACSRTRVRVRVRGEVCLVVVPGYCLVALY